MYSVLDDVYAVPQVKQFPYFAYRSELCLRRYEGQPIPPSLDVVAPDVLACQARFGDQPADPLINCIRAAMEKAAVN